MDACVEGFARANRLYPGKDLRHFLIHCDDTTKELAAKMVKNGVLAAYEKITGERVRDDLDEYFEKEAEGEKEEQS